MFREAKTTINKDNDLSQVISFVEDISQGSKKEFLLPKKISFDLFFSEIGKEDRDFELGGYFVENTRKIVFTRSNTQYSSYGVTGEALPHIGYHQTRDENGLIEGQLWHTHPSKIQEIRYLQEYKEKYVPSMNCVPSDEDNNYIFSTSLSEQVDGKGKTFVSIISASGFISETISSCPSLNISKLKEAGCSEGAIQALLVFLTYMPPNYIKNFAKKGEEEKLYDAFVNFYAKKMNFDGSFYRDIDKFLEDINDLLTDEKFERMTATAGTVLRKKLFRDLPPSFPNRRKLENMGFSSKEEQNIVLDMLGMRTSIFKINEDGRRELIFDSVFSCDLFDKLLAR